MPKRWVMITRDAWDDKSARRADSAQNALLPAINTHVDSLNMSPFDMLIISETRNIRSQFTTVKFSKSILI